LRDIAIRDGLNLGDSHGFLVSFPIKSFLSIPVMAIRCSSYHLAP
jgi:hypothetical protein